MQGFPSDIAQFPTCSIITNELVTSEHRAKTILYVLTRTLRSCSLLAVERFLQYVPDSW